MTKTEKTILFNKICKLLRNAHISDAYRISLLECIKLDIILNAGVNYGYVKVNGETQASPKVKTKVKK
jgi:hypothetical protein